jgi:hypothetical protein
MKVQLSQKSTTEFLNLAEHQLLLIPSYQREYCWSDEKKLLLIDSISKGIPIGLIQLRKLSGFQYEIIDGQHRIRTVLEVIMGKGVYFNTLTQDFSLDEKDFEYAKLVRSGGSINSSLLINDPELTENIGIAFVELWQKFRYMDLPCVIYEGTDEDVEVAFNRINLSGVQFTPDFKKLENSKTFKL